MISQKQKLQKANQINASKKQNQIMSIAEDSSDDVDEFTIKIKSKITKNVKSPKEKFHFEANNADEEFSETFIKETNDAFFYK